MFQEWLKAEGAERKIAAVLKDYLEGKGYRGPGLDKLFFSQYVRNGQFNEDFVSSEAETIYRKLTDRDTPRYTFAPFLQMDIPKGEDPTDTRPIAQASIRDAVVQALLLEYMVDAAPRVSFLACSYAYQKSKSALKAVKYIRNRIGDGYIWIYDADLSKYFDTIPHARLQGQIAQYYGDDPALLKLIERFLKTRVRPIKSFSASHIKSLKGKSRSRHECFPRDEDLSENGQPLGQVKPALDFNAELQGLNQRGIPQGGILSGFLANLYLHEFDQKMVQLPNTKYVRYADDFIVLSKNQEGAGQAKNTAQIEMGALGLKLHPLDSGKSRLCCEKVLEEDNGLPVGFKFLGFRFKNGTISAKKESIVKFKKRLQTVVKYQAIGEREYRGKRKKQIKYTIYHYNEQEKRFIKTESTLKRPKINCVFISKLQWENHYWFKNYMFSLYEIFREDPKATDAKLRYCWLTYFKAINDAKQLAYLSSLYKETVKAFYELHEGVRPDDQTLLSYRVFLSGSNRRIYRTFYKNFYGYIRNRNADIDKLTEPVTQTV